VIGENAVPAGEMTYAVVYAAARDLGYTELEAMAYATEPDLFVADHPELWR
jgi:hypothetical protein